MVMRELAELGLLDRSALTCMGPLDTYLETCTKPADGEVVRAHDDPFSPVGALRVLHGNLAPDGAIVKKSRRRPLHARAIPAPRACSTARRRPARPSTRAASSPGDVVVIRYEGPAGGPGMREMLTPTSAIVRHGPVHQRGARHRRALLRRHQGPGRGAREPGGRRGWPHRAGGGGRRGDGGHRGGRARRCTWTPPRWRGAARRGSRPRRSTNAACWRSTRSWFHRQTRGHTSHEQGQRESGPARGGSGRRAHDRGAGGGGVAGGRRRRAWCSATPAAQAIKIYDALYDSTQHPPRARAPRAGRRARGRRLRARHRQRGRGARHQRPGRHEHGHGHRDGLHGLACRSW